MAVAFLLINFAIGCVRPDSTCLEEKKDSSNIQQKSPVKLVPFLPIDLTRFGDVEYGPMDEFTTLKIIVDGKDRDKTNQSFADSQWE